MAIAIVARPTDYEMPSDAFGGCFGNYEQEIVARNIMLMMKAQGNQFKPFTWEQYKGFCHHNPVGEQAVLNIMVNGGKRPGGSYNPGGRLDWNPKKKTYCVNEMFLACIMKFKKKKARILPDD